jgi:hypothetical protein
MVLPESQRIKLLKKSGVAVSTDTIVIGMGHTCPSPSTPQFIEVSRAVTETGVPTWINMLVAFRKYLPHRNALSRIKVSLRKYQFIGGKWSRRQNFNVNSLSEARAVIRTLKVYFPEVADE